MSRRGVAVEVMTTAQAISTFNLLLAEGRPVAAALVASTPVSRADACLYTEDGAAPLARAADAAADAALRADRLPADWLAASAGAGVASLVAVQALLWLSALVHGAAVAVSLLLNGQALLDFLQSKASLDGLVAVEVPLTSGFFFLCGAALFLLIAAILASVAGCAAKGFPGIGRSAARCCCVERDGAGVAPVAPAAASGAEKDAALDVRDVAGEGAAVNAIGAAGVAVGVAAMVAPVPPPRSFFSRAPPPLIVELSPPVKRNVSAAKRGYNTRFG
jgi:hypothetical protein